MQKVNRTMEICVGVSDKYLVLFRNNGVIQYQNVNVSTEVLTGFIVSCRATNMFPKFVVSF